MPDRSTDGLAGGAVSRSRTIHLLRRVRRLGAGGGVSFTRDWRLAASRHSNLAVTGDETPELAPLDRELIKLLGRSLRLRQVSAGGCNGGEVEANALGNIV